MITYITSLSTLDELICYRNHLGRNSEQTAEYPSTSFYKHSCSILVVTLPVVRNPSTASWLNACDLQYLIGELEQPRMISIHIQISSKIYVHHNKHAQTSPKNVLKANIWHPSGAQSSLPYIWSIIGTAHAALPAFMAYIVGRVGCGRNGSAGAVPVFHSTRTEQTMAEIKSFVCIDFCASLTFGCGINHFVQEGGKHQHGDKHIESN